MLVDNNGYQNGMRLDCYANNTGDLDEKTIEENIRCHDRGCDVILISMWYQSNLQLAFYFDIDQFMF